MCGEHRLLYSFMLCLASVADSGFFSIGVLGRHSIRAMYNAIFDFNFNAALAQLDAPTLVLELLSPDEAHHGEQAAKVCSLMKRARAARVENGDRSFLEKNPLAIVTPILDFLRSQH